MKLRNFIRLSVLVVLISSFVNAENVVKNIDKYQINLDQKVMDAAGGFYPSIGSGLEFYQKLADSSLEFYGISDRGPNFPYADSDNKIVSFFPEYTPKIFKIIVSPISKKSEIQFFLDIKYHGKKVTGINPQINEQDEIIYNAKNFSQVTSDFGIDSESIGILKNGNFVVGDEYYPSINIIDHNTGEIIARMTPGNGLPEILQYRNFNRGFESVTVAPNGKIYAVLEGVLNLDEFSKKNAKFIRVLELDLQTKKTKTYMYKFDLEAYKDSSKVKIGDITAIDNDNFLIVEQGKGIDEKYRNFVYKINIKNASDISHYKNLEYSSLEDLKALKFIDKNLLFNVRDYAWEDNKLEGLTIIDNYTIAISNDNDFALDGYIEEDGNIKPIVNQNKKFTNLWIIKFKDKI